MNNIIKFENNNVQVVKDQDSILFELYSVGQAIGYTVTSKGKLYANKVRIDKVLENADITPVLQGVKQYLTEEMLYDFIFESRTDRAKKFRKWVTNEVLPQIRETGAYVSENITSEQQKLLKKYSAPRFRKQTFSTIPVEQISKSYKECMDYHKRKKAKEKINIKKEVAKVLEERKEIAINNGSSPLALFIAEEIKTIQKDITNSSNKSNAAKIGKANKEILNLQNKLNQLEPLKEEWKTIDYHPFTVNCCTMAVGERIVATQTYNKWKLNFPIEQIPKNQFNFNNPIYIWLEFEHEAKYDVANLHKTFIDKLCKEYGVDDQYIQIMRCCTRSYVDNYKDGKIHFVIREGVWQ